MRIREIVNEGLPLKITKQYRRNWNPNMYADLFRQFPDRDRNAFRIYLPINIQSTKAVTPPEIADYLKEKGYEVTDYTAGLAKEINGKRVMRIGRLLQDNPNLLKRFMNDPSRAASKIQNKLVCISRHPHDVASMSTGRGWTSCLNLIDGENRRYVMYDVKMGSLVAYLINANDRNIQNPIARLTIKPFVSVTDPNDVVFVREPNVFGTEIPEFGEVVEKWLEQVNHGRSGLYCLSDKLYTEYDIYSGDIPADSFEHNNTLILPKGVFKQAINNARAFLNNPEFIDKINNLSSQLKSALIEKNPDFILAIKNPSPKLVYTAIQIKPEIVFDLPKPTQNQIERALYHGPHLLKRFPKPEPWMIMSALSRDGMVLKSIKNPTPEMIKIAVKSNGNALQFVKNPTPDLIEIALRSDGNAIRWIKNPTPKQRLLAVENDGEAIRYITDPTPREIKEAIRNTPEAIRYIDNPSEEMMILAVKEDPDAIKHIANAPDSVWMALMKTGSRKIEKLLTYYPKGRVPPYDLMAKMAGYDPLWLMKRFKNQIPERLMTSIFRDYPEMAKKFPNLPEKVQLWLVNQDPNNMVYINRPTDKAILTALKSRQEPDWLNYSKLSPEQQVLVVNHNPKHIATMYYPSLKAWETAIKLNYTVIEEADRYGYRESGMFSKLAMLAIKTNWRAINHIEDPTPEMVALAQKLKAKDKTKAKSAPKSKVRRAA